MRIAGLALAVVVVASPATAATKLEMAALGDALQLSRIIDVMRDEGMESANEIADAFQIPVGASWQRDLNAIYDADWMEEVVLNGMAEAFGQMDPTPITAFFSTELGSRIIELEISARIAFMDDSVEQASNETAARLPVTDPERFARLDAFIEINNLVESNVIGALNSNYAFMKALADAGGMDGSASESQLLNEVYAQEPDIRNDTGRWLYSFLSLAYQPLSDDELDLYLDFSRSDAGQAMNRALFDGFDDMFVGVSRALGELVGQRSVSEEL